MKMEIHIFSTDTETTKKLVNNSDRLFIGGGFFGPSFRYKGKKLNSTQLIRLYREDKNFESVRLYKMGRSQNIWGNILGFPAGFLLGQELYNTFSKDRKSNSKVLTWSVVGSIISASLNIAGIRNMKKSVSNYNNLIELTYGPTMSGGVGLTMIF
jgi:hypothetical protein